MSNPTDVGRGARMRLSMNTLSKCVAAAAMAYAAVPAVAQHVPPAPPLGIESMSSLQPEFDSGPLLVRTQTAKLRLVERASRVVELPDNITHVTDFDPNVVAIDPLTPTTIRVSAAAPGVTSIVFTDVHQVTRSLEVFVSGDTRHLEANLEYLFPDTSISAHQVGNNVVLRGYVARPSEITEIIDVARNFYPEVHNQLQVSTNDRVVLHAKVAEVNRSRLRQFGVNFAGTGTDAIFNNATGGIGAASTLAGGGPLFQLAEGVLQNPNLSFAFRASGSDYGLFIEALKQEAILRILAEPSVTATSGRPATLLSGGEFPILVPQGLGQTAIEFREFGISIEAVCVVLGDGRVRLDISPEVSDLDFTNGVTLDGIRIPGLTTRRVNTQAEMKFGETLVLGGLISKRRIGSTTKVPFLGELPYVGAAFSRKRYEDAETELLIMVTPVPAAPFGPGECVPPGPGESSSDPTDKELYWKGMIELPKYGERCGPGMGCPPAAMDHGGMIMPQGCAPQAGAIAPVEAPIYHEAYPAGEPYSPPPMAPPVPMTLNNHGQSGERQVATGSQPQRSTPARTLADSSATAEPTVTRLGQPATPPTVERLDVSVEQVSYSGEHTVGAKTIQTRKPAQTTRKPFMPFATASEAQEVSTIKPSAPIQTSSGWQASKTKSPKKNETGQGWTAAQPRSASAGLIRPSNF